MMQKQRDDRNIKKYSFGYKQNQSGHKENAMPELKYLKDKKIVFRDEPFVMDVIYSMEKGNASI